MQRACINPCGNNNNCNASTNHLKSETQMAFSSARARALAVTTLVLRIITLGLLAASLAVIASLARTQYDVGHVDIIGDYDAFSYIVGVAPRELFGVNFQDLYTFR
jgi:uncharacterized membrane protein YjgN (DUF898 family)